MYEILNVFVSIFKLYIMALEWKISSCLVIFKEATKLCVINLEQEIKLLMVLHGPKLSPTLNGVGPIPSLFALLKKVLH